MDWQGSNKKRLAIAFVVLVELAGRLRHCVRAIDTVARFSGDEFAVVLGALHEDRERSLTRAQAMAEKIRKALAEPYVRAAAHGAEAPSALRHRCTASIGLTLFCGPDASAEALINQAGVSKYQVPERALNRTGSCPCLRP